MIKKLGVLLMVAAAATVFGFMFYYAYQEDLRFAKRRTFIEACELAGRVIMLDGRCLSNEDATAWAESYLAKNQ